MSLGSLPEPVWAGERIQRVNSASTRGLANSQRLLLVPAFLAGERRTVCSFGRRHTIWCSALSAPCLNARIALLYSDGLSCHRLPNQPLRFSRIDCFDMASSPDQYQRYESTA